jgi:LuxR family maltose regulon positive regulatory protein
MAENASAQNGGPALTDAFAWAQTTVWEEGALLSAQRFFDFIYLYEHIRIVRAQIFITWARTTGDQSLLHEILSYLERQRAIAEAGSLLWFQIKIYLLQALAYQALGDAEPARTALTYALHLAEPEGYLRVFLDEGEPLRLLIAECGVQNAELSVILRTYAEKILAAFKQNKAEMNKPIVVPPFRTPHSALRTSVEPLSDRELEVLQLVAAGYSNSEIADRLIVAASTVKTHVNRIFGKLAVQSRTQAIMRARELGLLGVLLIILLCNDFGFPNLEPSLIAQFLY